MSSRGTNKHKSKYSKSKSRSRSRSRSRNNSRILAGTEGWPKETAVEEFTEHDGDIHYQKGGVKRVLKMDPAEGVFYWMTPSKGQVMPRLTKRKDSDMKTRDLLVIWAWLQRRKTMQGLSPDSKTMQAAASAGIDLGVFGDEKKLATYTEQVKKEARMTNFVMSKALSACMSAITVDKEGKGKEMGYKNIFIWKGEARLAELNLNEKSNNKVCRNLMIFGIVEDSKDLLKYEARLGDGTHKFGFDICTEMAGNNSSTLTKYNAVNNLITSTYRPDSGCAIVVIEQDIGGSITAYRYARGDAYLPRFFEVTEYNGVTTKKEVSSGIYSKTVKPNPTDGLSQLHIVLGNKVFGDITQQGTIDWLMGNTTNKLLASNLTADYCKNLTEVIGNELARDKDVTMIYAVIDESRMMEKAVTAARPQYGNVPLSPRYDQVPQLPSLQYGPLLPLPPIKYDSNLPSSQEPVPVPGYGATPGKPREIILKPGYVSLPAEDKVRPGYATLPNYGNLPAEDEEEDDCGELDCEGIDYEDEKKMLENNIAILERPGADKKLLEKTKADLEKLKADKLKEEAAKAALKKQADELARKQADELARKQADELTRKQAEALKKQAEEAKKRAEEAKKQAALAAAPPAPGLLESMFGPAKKPTATPAPAPAPAAAPALDWAAMMAQATKEDEAKEIK